MVWTHNYMAFYKFVLLIGLPIVHLYHLLCSNIFLNTSAQDAKGMEWVGNMVLMPYQYFFVGQEAIPTNDPDIPYYLIHKFQYDDSWKFKTISSLILLPQSIALGTLCKGIAYLSKDTSERHEAIRKSIYLPVVKLHKNDYRKVGISLDGEIKKIKKKSNFIRREGDENNLSKDKEVLKEVIEILEMEQIPYWVDCGTCLGVFRYEGVIPWDNDIDIAILQPDFDNVKRALRKLDPNRYAVLDWSSRDKPKSFLKVYLKGTDVLLDIYNYRINEGNNSFEYILSNEDNVFMSEEWRHRERKYKTAVPFDLIFPLKKALFDGIEVSVPNKIEEYLKLRYGENLDPIMIFDKESNSYINDPNHPYWKFME